MALILAYRGRGITKDLTVLDGAGAVITPGDNDKLRVIIGREGHLGTDNADAELVVTSGDGGETENGSTLTIGGGVDGAHRLRLDGNDLDFSPGVYTFFFDYFDNADAEEWKNIDRQVFVLEDT